MFGISETRGGLFSLYPLMTQGHPWDTQGTRASPHTGPRHHRRHHDDRYFGSRWQLAPGSWWRLEGLLSGLDLRSSWCPRRWRGPAPWFPGRGWVSQGCPRVTPTPWRCRGGVRDSFPVTNRQIQKLKKNEKTVQKTKKKKIFGFFKKNIHIK